MPAKTTDDSDAITRSPVLDAQTAPQAALLTDYLRAASTASLGHVLTPIAALSEVLAVSNSVHGGRPAPRAQDRRSLKADTETALVRLGRDVKRELQPTLLDYQRSILHPLPDLLDDRPGTRRIRGATHTLLELLKRHGCAQAAWRDLLSTVTSWQSDDDALLCALQLRELAEALGYEWRWLELRLVELIREGSFAGAEEILSDPPSQTAQAAWFIFANADIRGAAGYLRVGQVQFFSHRLWPDAVRDRTFVSRLPDAQFPEELDDPAISSIFQIESQASDFVYARVELTGLRAASPRNPWAHARAPLDWARDLVSGIVEAATFKRGGSIWILLGGGAVYHGYISDESGSYPEWSGSFPFHEPELFFDPRRFSAPLREGTGEAIEELQSSFAILLAEGDSAAQSAVAEVGWYESVASQRDPAQRIGLHIRAFERALPIPKGERWPDAVRRYFRDVWALTELWAWLFQLADSSTRMLERLNPPALASIEQITVRDDPKVTVFGAALIRNAATLADLLPTRYYIERRRLRELAAFATTGPAALKPIDDLRERFSILLARALRQRNAVIHGITTVPDVVATVDPFIARLAGFIVAEGIDGAASGVDLVRSLERIRAVAARRIWRLAHDDAPVHRILYDAEDEVANR